MPGIGHFRLDLLDRHYPFRNVWKYVVAYRGDVTPVEVVAVVHGARDLGPFFADRLP